MGESLKTIVWLLCLVYCNEAARAPNSPCPTVFAYEGETESDRWYGVITFSSNIELIGLNYRVQLDRPAQLLVSWDGEVRTEDNINFNIFNPYATQDAGQLVKARIMVKYNSVNGIPAVTRIIINGNTMCSTTNEGRVTSNSGAGIGLSNNDFTSTTRFDPSFVDDSDNGGSQSNSGSSYDNYGQSYGSNQGNFGNNQDTYQSNSQPTYNQPTNSQPSYNQPTYSQPTNNQPTYNQPTNNQPTYNQPTNNQPTYQSSYPNNQYGSNSNRGNSNPDPSYGNIPSYPNEIEATSQQSTRTYPTGNANWPTDNQNTDMQTQAGGAYNINVPVVTTLSLQNNNSASKNNIDQIVQIIKNQLEQQQFNSNSNKTFIVAVLNPVTTSGSSSSSSTTTSTTTTTTTTTTAKPKYTTASHSNSKNKNKD